MTVVHCYCTLIANYLSTVESNRESENDNSLVEDDSNEVNDMQAYTR